MKPFILSLLLATSAFGQADYTSLLLLHNQAASGGAGPSGTQVASDNFDSYGTFQALGDQANWDIAGGGGGSTDTHLVVVHSGADKAVSGGSGGTSADYHTGSYNADQYATATLVGLTGSADSTVGVAVRVQSGAVTYYTAQYRDASSRLYLRRVNAGAETTILDVAKTYSSGVKLWLQAVGSGSATRLSVWEDTGSGWVAVWTSEDPGGTYIDNGKPGVGGKSNSLDAKANDWSGGNVP